MSVCNILKYECRLFNSLFYVNTYMVIVASKSDDDILNLTYWEETPFLRIKQLFKQLDKYLLNCDIFLKCKHLF